MALSDDLKKEVKEIFSTRWEERKGAIVPSPENISHGNEAVNLDAVVLYADLAESTDLVDRYKNSFAAEVYKSYLKCCSKIIAAEGGYITSFDGDRVMGIFIGKYSRTRAVRAALKINYTVLNILNPAIKSQYPNTNYIIKHAVGIDESKVFVARAGIRGSSDLVWVGRAANYAAKLCSLREGNYATWITEDIYKYMANETKFTNGTNMWKTAPWPTKNITVYCSEWTWVIR